MKGTSKVIKAHYFKLIVRSILLLAAIIEYGVNEIQFGNGKRPGIVLSIIWFFMAAEMLLRFFPSELQSMGARKQYVQNYLPYEEKRRIEPANSGFRTFLVAAVWIILNGAVGGVYLTGIIGAGIMFIISLAFSVCDVICILYFCPFQAWFMKNRCCTTCRIYNWDYAMMFTPLIFIRSFYTLSLFAMGLIILVKWEISFRLHPERFSPFTNKCLSCAVCTSKECRQKAAIKRALKNHRSAGKKGAGQLNC